mgnify:CR=1 FL=1
MKAVAIPYVIALIFGVIVISILAYWIINQSGKTSAAGSSAECQAKAFSYCVQWQVKGGDAGPTFNWDKCSSEEADYKDKKDKCKELGVEIK